MKPKREAVLLSAALLAYSNGLALIAMRRGRAADAAYRWTNPVLMALLLPALSRARRLPVSAILLDAGLHTRNLPQALGGGLLLGVLLSGPPLIFFARPLVLDEPLEYGRIDRLTPRAFWWRMLVELPFGIAMFEELTFRGLLFSAWSRAASPRTANLATAATFAAWHFAVSIDTMRHTNIQSAAVRVPKLVQRHANALGVGGGMAVTAVGGLLFSGLRLRVGGSVFAPALAHLIVDASMVAALHRRGQRQ
ncbi:MAG: CPBP family intramembrane glutamic endopeptidase [Chloroflexia bacterium]